MNKLSNLTIEFKLTTLRQIMRENKLDFYLVPSIDAHNSEYVPSCWQRRSWISHFTGSAGEALIGINQALLSTDGRYFLQAEQELDSQHFELLRQQGFVAETELWLKQHASGKVLGVDPKTIGIARYNQLNLLMESIGGRVIKLAENLIDKTRVLAGEQIVIPVEPVIQLGDEYTGQSVADKLLWLRSQLVKHDASAIGLNALDEIAWLFNIRGNDIEFNPYVISYSLITQDSAIIYANLDKFSENTIQHFAKIGVQIKEYDKFANDVANVTTSIWLDDKVASQWMLDVVAKDVKIILFPSPIVLKKALKNPTEIQGMRNAHIKDAVAMVNFLYWLEGKWQSGVSEISASDKLASFRFEQQGIYGLSFASISGFASNGAIIHYRATEQTNKMIDDSTLYLIDSGGQYLDGTTDITRTLHLGKPTLEQKTHYTLVLKGHLALARARFVEGTKGEHLDALARLPLWQYGLNYRHGTGHGVGCFLGVHEGPQKISAAASTVALQAGMVVSNEPGLYITDKYGIRIENLLLINKVNIESEYGEFYEFEDLTLVPYCNKLIEFSLLSSEEKTQLSTYYRKIREKILPLVEGEVYAWLDEQLKLW